MLTTAGPWSRWPRILAEDLRLLEEPLGALPRAEGCTEPGAVARLAARALVDPGEELPAGCAPWLTPHQRPAARRLLAILRRHGGAVLADGVGLGKSFVALAVAQALGGRFALVVPAVLEHQWRVLLARAAVSGPLLSHERLSRSAPSRLLGDPALLVVDEAHHFRDPATRRYRALARLSVGRRVLLVTATPIHNRIGDLLHLLRLFLSDDALTALGVPSLRRAAREHDAIPGLAAAAARLVVARSRDRARVLGGPLAFPRRDTAAIVRAATAADGTVADLLAAIQQLRADDRAGALIRLLLLTRLASSVPALRASLVRLEAFAAAAADAARCGRTFGPRDFARWFPASDTGDVQLALLPLLAEPGAPPRRPDRIALRTLIALARDGPDPKAQALDELLAAIRVKTIVFTGARATARHLARLLARRHRVALVTGSGGAWGGERVGREDVLRAFAPGATGAAPPPPALATDVLIATDLLSEGLNLQDAARVVHYDLPWSPARLAQRVGRIDRLGSPHAAVASVTFLPPPALADAIDIESRLARKASLQWSAGAAALETPAGAGRAGALDWCDRIQTLGERGGAMAPAGSWCVLAQGPSAAVLVLRFGGPAGPVDALVVDRDGCHVDPERASRLLEAASTAPGIANEGATLVSAALAQAAGVIRERLRALELARWRAADRDGAGRRLVPWVLAAARRAARGGDTRRVARLDALVGRLTRGLTAGAELQLSDLLERRRPLRVEDVLLWHERLPPPGEPGADPPIEFVAAVVFDESARPAVAARGAGSGSTFPP